MTPLAWTVFIAAAIACAFALDRMVRRHGLRRLAWIAAFLATIPVMQHTTAHAHYSWSIALLISTAISVVVYGGIAQIEYARSRRALPQHTPTRDGNGTSA